jgi:hypothetical protein
VTASRVAVQAGGEEPQGWGAVGVDPLHPAEEFVASGIQQSGVRQAR